MELPAEVLIHNEIMGFKGITGTLITISPDGYYEVNCLFGEQAHRTLFPVQGTVLIARDPEEVLRPDLEIER
ncbi:MAG TPA: hypothetical protein VOA80_06520 [Thermoanaerobaculia bacterium]|jgi:hypothetical protein|nr:hypothetical protein [Thermoanaerobaculia bacterium]